MCFTIVVYTLTINQMKIFKIYFLALVAIMTFYSCNKNEDQESELDTGNLIFYFEHFEHDKELLFDEMRYTNAVGNQYEITDIQWFISDMTLHKNDGSAILLDDENFAHFIDTNLPETHKWIINEKIPAGEYNSISMTFGIKGKKNIPFMFTDPPESNMLWPINLGGEYGGYHYMKLNGFWMNKDDKRQPFNFHLGVGQERDMDNKIIGFIQNWFETELPSSGFSLKGNETKSILLRMNVERWWDSPNVYDHDIHGSKIMQNQQAMKMGVENGENVFSVGSISSMVKE